jgi:hypothetical protein
MGFKLILSPTPLLWDRELDVGLAWPEAPESIGLITDANARRLLARAKRRYYYAYLQPAKADTVTDDNVVAGGLAGFCFIVADEVTQFLISQMGFSVNTVKTVCVSDAGKKNHWFTVVIGDKKKTSHIVDATWQQFVIGDSVDKKLCIAGTLSAVKTTLKGLKFSAKLLDAYDAGLAVVDANKRYLSGFPAPKS